MNDPGLVRALASLVGDGVDTADILTHLVRDAVTALRADAVALVAPAGDDDLALLSASSHRAGELELLESQRHTGPCVDVLTGHAPVSCIGGHALVARWGAVGQAITEAGFRAVEAHLMQWRGVPVGGFNVFYATATVSPDDDLKQAYADMAALVVQAAPLSGAEVSDRLAAALAERERIEQATGVVAELAGVDLESAYQRLVVEAKVTGVSLGRLADDVVHRRRGV